MMRRNSHVLILCAALAALLGCASGGVNVMLPATTVPEATEAAAAVTFLRPSSFAFAIKFGIWDGEDLVGVLAAKSSITVQVEPGEHVFLGRAENWGVVKADLEAGEHYYVRVRARMGLSKAGVILEPVTSETSQEQLQQWLAAAKPKQVDPAQEQAYVAERVSHVRRALQNVADGNADFNTLSPEDGR